MKNSNKFKNNVNLIPDQNNKFGANWNISDENNNDVQEFSLLNPLRCLVALLLPLRVNNAGWQLVD